MALINCPECGKQVSTHAESCPNCGCPKDAILESVEKRRKKLKPVEELTEEERAKRKAYLDELEELHKQYKEASVNLDNIAKCIEKHKEFERKNKRESWTWMDSGSLWWF